MATAASVEALCVCLLKMLGSLERGDPIEAVGMVSELNGIVRESPVDAPQEEVERARQLLVRCVELERSLRKQVIESMRRLGAVRKSMVYRRMASRP